MENLVSLALSGLEWLCPGSTVVEYPAHNPKIGGLNPATALEERKWQKPTHLGLYSQHFIFFVTYDCVPFKCSTLGQAPGLTYKH